MLQYDYEIIALYTPIQFPKSFYKNGKFQYPSEGLQLDKHR
jgi:hypothetical protein